LGEHVSEREPLAYFREWPARAGQLVDLRAGGRQSAELWMYVTGAERPGPAPIVVYPHNGPHSRNFFGFDAWAQFFASRGYIVVQPNFRGSSGAGAAFEAAGRSQWGRRMQDDVTDALQHAIAAGWADPQRVCIVGYGYGGYAALAGAAFTPELYRCAIAVSAIAEPEDLIRAYTPEQRRSPAHRRAVRSAGGDREALAAVSPMQHAERIRAAVLLLDGAGEESGDFIDHSERMERALLAAGKDVRLVRQAAGWGLNWWPQDDHAAALREMETFLAQHLGPAN
jgi:dipeptidyl aminopeptidase/acylaminoacyl peptidase